MQLTGHGDGTEHMFIISLAIPSLGVVVVNGSLLMSTSYADVDSLVIASRIAKKVPCIKGLGVKAELLCKSH